MKDHLSGNSVVGWEKRSDSEGKDEHGDKRPCRVNRVKQGVHTDQTEGLRLGRRGRWDRGASGLKQNQSRVHLRKRARPMPPLDRLRRFIAISIALPRLLERARGCVDGWSTAALVMVFRRLAVLY